MTIKITVADRVQFSVRGTMAGETGAQEAFDFRLTAKRLNEEGLQAALSQADRNVIDFLCDVVTGWKGVLDDQGNDVPYSPEALRQLCGNCLGIGPLAFEAYLDSVKAKAKN